MIKLKPSYLLFLKVKKDLILKIGKLGKIKFKKGIYCYVGSGGINIEKRIKRHFLKNKKLRWHIDYLTNSKYVKPLIALIFKINERKLASTLLKKFSYIKNFGSTDTKNKSHLFYIGSKNEFEKFKKEIKKLKPFTYILKL